ncbi:MAG: toll/interleukin-1 receptor domain-containing protein [Peptococcaceae bacterium]|jgi:tetratricopeptide (TPR) repeat protein|nr:toll/interleukin-1 receptor domain-containing protein [Peptococcaceae bacterium]
MTIFKCKLCGGDIVAVEGQSYGTCDSCGTTTTLPTASDERLANLFNRANHFRRLNEFDKALAAYENILNEENSDAEAHWGAALSRFGVEYVEDPRTHERVPTLHRVQFESILSDGDYLAALEHTPDDYTRSLYEKEAAAIAGIQKGILAISRQEEPFDVFLCYKETSDAGTRTKDSTLAQDIYYQLDKAGYRVFFSRITLEDKLGQAYEPYIFSALNSARVMLVIGTKPEYFNAVWVKNEWSRYLALMKKDKSRLLIPCYQSMDAYDLPEELSFLQSQNMSKIGFIQDLLRGVQKVLDAGKTASAPQIMAAANTESAAPSVESLYKRGMLFLEDSDWKQADEYFDKVLDINPEYAPAYVGKLCAELHVWPESALLKYHEPISERGSYIKALRFADASLKATLNGYKQANLARLENARKAREEAERHRREEEERQAKENAEAEARQKEAHKKQIRIATIIGSAAAVVIVAILIVTHVIIPHIKYNAAQNLLVEKKYDKAMAAFEALGAYRDSAEQTAIATNRWLATCSVGQIVKFGDYSWLMLDNANGKALLITEDIIELRAYNSKKTSTTWETCDLRAWLNGDFYNKFTDSEKAMIAETVLSNPDNAQYGTDGGNDTHDRVFLLSVDEVVQYFSSTNARIAFYDGSTTRWWLRSPGRDGLHAADVYVDGSADEHALTNSIGVRPALYINLEH